MQSKLEQAWKNLYGIAKENGRKVELERWLSQDNTAYTNFYTEQDTYNKVINPNVLKFEDCEIIEDFEDFNNFLLSLPNDTDIAIDFETTGIDPLIDRVGGVGISLDALSSHNFYIKVTLDNKPTVAAILDLICRKFDCIIAHNFKFEWSFLYTNFGVQLDPNKMFDTMTATYLLGKKSISLKSAANEYLGRYPLAWQELVNANLKQVNKDNVTCLKEDNTTAYCVDELPLEAIAPYCCEDTRECLLLKPILEDELHRHGLTQIFKVDSQNNAVAALMEVKGVRTSKDAFNYAATQVSAIIEDLEDRIYVLANKELNINSPEQLSNLLFNDLKLPVEGIPKTIKGYSTSKAVLAELEGTHPIVDLIVKYKQSSGLITKFVKPFDSHVRNSRIHPNINLCRTATGRLSCSNPNLQQFPNPLKYLSLGDLETAELGRSLRRCFIPDKGKKIIQADWSSFELVILAHFSNCKTLIEVFNKGLSLHDVITCKLFNIDKLDKSNPEHQSKRTVCKTINFGIIYGMTWVRLQRECKKLGINLSKDESQAFIDAWFDVLPEVKLFFAHCRIKAIVKGYAETILGRKRFFKLSHPYLQKMYGSKTINLNDWKECLETWNKLEQLGVLDKNVDQQIFRQSQNTPIQGSNADACRVAMNEIYRELVLPKLADLLLIVHDEFVLQADEAYSKYVYNKLQSIMVNVFKLSVPIEADPVIAASWGDCK